MTDIDHSDESRRRRRYERERAARLEAESIAEKVTRQLYATGLELKRVNDQLAAANDILEHANQSIKEFVAVASHDMRNPLTSVLGYTRTVMKKWDLLTDEQKLEFLQIIEEQGSHLERLVDDLLTISRIEAGAVETHIEDIYIRMAIEETLREFGERASDVGIVANEKTRVRVDPDHLERILVNYLGNALKYGDPPYVAEAREMDQWVEVRVRDEGEGVPPDFVPRLFGKFARADTEGTRRQKGTGLGLSIVRGLARANGGDAWYEPNHPKGSCFGVRLPLAG